MKKLILPIVLFSASCLTAKTHVDVTLDIKDDNEAYRIDKSVILDESPLMPVGDGEVTIDVRRNIETDKVITLKSKVIFKDTILCEPLLVVPFGEKATVTFSKEDGSLVCSLTLRPHREKAETK